MADMLTDLVDYSRQDGLEVARKVKDFSHAVIGCGGIGYWTAIFLAMMGAKTITIMDGDNVEPSNLPRIPVMLRHRDMMKVKVLKLTLKMLRPMVNVIALPQHIDKHNARATIEAFYRTMGFCVIWDCTDDARIQQVIAEHADEYELNYIKLGYEGWGVGVYGSGVIRSLWIGDDYRPGYVTNASSVLSSVIASALGITTFLRHGGMPMQGSREANILTMLNSGGQ